MKLFRLTPIAAAVLAVYAVPTMAQSEEAKAPVTTERAVALPAVRVEDQAEGSYKAEAVSSPKYTEPLVNTPQTITVIKKEILQERVATTLTDALRLTPGITMLQGENGNTTSGDAISMRGFDTQNSIFLDNIRDLGSAVRDVFNVEQIEVVKGPVGADNGRGATSGYINLASKLPLAESFQSGTISYGTEDRRRGTADLNQAIGANSAVRLNLVGQDGGVPGRDFIERRSWGVAPSIAFGLDTATRIYLFSQHVRQDNVPDGGVPTVGREGYRFSNATNNPVQQTLDDAGVTVAAPDSENYYGFKDDFEDIEANMFTVKFEHDLKPGTVIRNLSRYGKSDQERILTGVNAVTVVNGTPGAAGGATGTPPPASPSPAYTVRDPNAYTVTRSVQHTARSNEILTNQTNLTTELSTGAIKHSLGGGVEVIYEKQFTPTAVSNTTSLANLYNPNPNDPRPEVPFAGGFADGQTVTTAVYAFDTLRITDRWLLNGSLRWERYETETETGTVSGTTLTANRIEDADNLLSWKTGVLFKPTNNSSVYYSHANSFVPPGGNNFTLVAQTVSTPGSTVNANTTGLDPQEATNDEIGTKWDLLGGRLAATAAIFKSTNKNELATSTVDPNVVEQFGEREVKGIELNAVGQITTAWAISFGVTKLEAEIKEGTVTSSGAAARFTPELTGTLWTTYKLQPYKLVFGFGAQYVDGQVRSENNDPNGTVTPTTGQVGLTNVYKVGAYTVFDAMVAYEATPNVTVQLNGYNITDEEYFAAINNGGSRFNPGTPLSYLLSLNIRL